jgi:hypothetical protein
MMERVPEVVFITLGVPRARAKELGMLGCGLQLDDAGEYHWREATITLDLGRWEVTTFLRVEGIPFTHIPGFQETARITFLQMETYINKFKGIKEFLALFRRNKFLRLGRKAYLDPWELNSQDSYVLRMSDEDFLRYYIADPRGQLLASEITSRHALHTPVLRGVVPPGLPDPEVSGWI